MANKYLLGVDFGTTGTRSIIYDLQGNELGNAYKENIITYPEPGSYEYDGHSWRAGLLRDHRAGAQAQRHRPPRHRRGLLLGNSRLLWHVRRK